MFRHPRRSPNLSPVIETGTTGAAEPRTVTFVFSDLEGSTRLLATLRDAYGPLLEAYHDLIESVFASHGGTQLDQAGDGLFHSFPSARAAAAAAIEAQSAMAVREWTRMKKNDSQECRNCHDAAAMDPEKQSETARARHAKAKAERTTCIDCHFGIAHKEPDGPGPKEIKVSR